jgi:CheY-like chemotaxis protein
MLTWGLSGQGIAPMPELAQQPDAANLNVLVVDDDGWIRDLVERVLSNAGYHVTLAEDGLEAVEELREQTPALILLDLLMPRMDGVTFADELKRSGLRPEVPILVLSAHPYTRQKAAQMGAEGCLDKPFRLPALLAEVARLAAQRSKSPPAASGRSAEQPTP